MVSLKYRTFKAIIKNSVGEEGEERDYTQISQYLVFL